MFMVERQHIEIAIVFDISMIFCILHGLWVDGAKARQIVLCLTKHRYHEMTSMLEQNYIIVKLSKVRTFSNILKLHMIT